MLFSNFLLIVIFGEGRNNKIDTIFFKYSVYTFKTDNIISQQVLKSFLFQKNKLPLNIYKYCSTNHSSIHEQNNQLSVDFPIDIHNNILLLFFVELNKYLEQVFALIFWYHVKFIKHLKDTLVRKKVSDNIQFDRNFATEIFLVIALFEIWLRHQFLLSSRWIITKNCNYGYYLLNFILTSQKNSHVGLSKYLNKLLE